MSQLEQDLKELNTQIDEAKVAIKKLEARVDDYIKQQKEATTKEEKAKVQESINIATSDITSLRNLLSKYEDQKAELKAESKKLAAQGGTKKAKLFFNAESIEAKLKRYFFSAPISEKCKMDSLEEKEDNTGQLNFVTLPNINISKFPTQIIIRQSYIDIYNLLYPVLTAATELKPSTQPVVVTGSSGCGKTYFAFYTILELLKSEPTRTYEIYVDIHPDCFFVIHSDNDISILNRVGFNALTINKFDVYIFDKSNNAERYPLVTVDGARIIITTSPGFDAYKAAETNACKYMIMPIWDMVELNQARVTCFKDLSEDDMYKVFQHTGGIARFCLHDLNINRDDVNGLISDVLSGYEAQIESQLSNIDANLNSIGRRLLFLHKDDISHKLLHLISSNYLLDTLSLQFASNYVLEIFIKAKQKSNADIITQYLSQWAGLAPFASVRGQIWEMYTIQLLRNGGTFRIYELQEDGQVNSTPEDLMIDGTNIKILEFNKHSLTDIVVKDNNVNIMGIPVSKSFGAIDCLYLPCLSMFQMTVSLHHGCKHYYANQVAQGMKKLMNKLDDTKCMCNLIFVIPDEIPLNDFKVQPWLNKDKSVSKTTVKGIKQYKLPLKFTGTSNK